MKTNNRKKRWGWLTRLTHEREVDIQAAFVVDERGITDAMRLDPIADVLSKLVVARLCAIQLI
jgi:hypothetical protein